MKHQALAESKRMLRQQMKLRRDGLHETAQTARSAAIRDLALSFIRKRDARAPMLYLSFRSEVRTDALIESLWAEGRDVIVPVSNPFDRSLTLYYLRNWDELITGAYGIREPDPGLAEPCEAVVIPDIVFVPGLAFDERGGRLGYGGGYYDRFRETLGQRVRELGRRIEAGASTIDRGDATINIGEAASLPEPLWIGLAYGEQRIDQVPMEPHDALMDGLITEQGIWLRSTDERGAR
ncbi:5-formyltetrahydrofolate cyclo-ligase [Paenibacillus sp. 598K]|uniref:5-formyltetrahydrofolate cyclo-ligase n=1 Tax=Paenibacillus sp. 598K TaxID=1117987 RepID=UPI000FF94FEA|nr:5-formyltetrahydrofolate cyclo-ligase [Paenibacillus sp. 598K]GBF77262.1 5-formyltetrahydrofolate cyclo-ligase [Paenibacillus sp. 598K]